ncbi:zinc finger protein 469-like [Megalops cyprinoides]|uniref:zinc finger protein 469-like n=1 Tax=Megalops cyprinoides TaxID=118141 RepID=UPI0018651E52|nr:zinc finger protein 469-like [Megalops cyprinoides]
MVLPIASDDMSVNQSVRANKRPSERKGRRRLEGGLKPKDKQYKCKVCFTWFLTLGELNFHKLSHNPSPPPTCYMCVQRKFSSREQLRDHLREKHAKNKAGIWTCGMCLKEISDVWMYNEHLREHATQFARKGQTQRLHPGPARLLHARRTAVEKLSSPPSCSIGPDAKELKDHLKNEHEEMEEQDSKHTTLYTCELCADVMHVIKKSFICSTCNYTFSKKEQFDRHMEKHLSGGNEIFKFRGVVRPSKPSSSSTKNGEFDLPPCKRRKLLTDRLLENSSDSGSTNIVSTQYSQTSESQVPKPVSPTSSDLTETSGDLSAGSADAGIKTEDIAGDFSEILMELEQSKLPVVSESLCFSEVPPSEQAAHMQTSEACKEGDTPSETYDIKEENHLHSNQKRCDTVSPALTECMASEEEAGSKVNMLPSPIEVSTEIASASAAEATGPSMNMSESAMSVEESDVHINENFMNISEAPSLPEEVSLPCCSTDTEQKSLDAAVDLTGKERSEHLTEIQRNESEENEQNDLKSAEPQSGGQDKDDVSSKSSESTNSGLDDGLKPAAGGLGAAQSTKHCYKPTALGSGRSEEKVFVRQQKKRRELKTSQSSKGSSSATRENLDVDMRNRKKLRVQSPGKGEWMAGYRKTDTASDYPVLSCMRDDKVSNKIPPKHKAGGLNAQPKRNTLDSNPPKKIDNMRHLNGTYKGRKGVPGRPLHPPASKTSVPMVNNSINKYRPLSGVRPVESHSYRTAESQNHLLSQLFGQKLTSFKIPLRKDTSEALN